MKNLFTLLLSTLFLVSCVTDSSVSNSSSSNNTIANNPNSFGEIITFDNATDARTLPLIIDSVTEKEIKITGRVKNVCQMSGCWLDVEIDSNQYVHVTFKDGAFVVPKDIEGKTVAIKGKASKEIILVELLKRIARNHGKPENEIDTIQTPLIEYYIEADGVIVK